MSPNPWRWWPAYRRRLEVADEARVAAVLACRAGSGMTAAQVAVRTGLGETRTGQALDRMVAAKAVLWGWDDWRHPRQKFFRLAARTENAGG